MLFKQELLTVPNIPITLQKKNNEKSVVSFYAAAAVVSLKKSGKILIVDFYLPEQDTPCIRFFADKAADTFITYVTKSKKFVKTMLARNLEMINSHYSLVTVESDKSRKIAMDYLGIHSSSFFSYSLTRCSVDGIAATCEIFCQRIRDEKRAKEMEKHFKRQNEYHSQFLDIFNDYKAFNQRAKEWNKWIETRFHKEYLFFSNYDKKHKRKCYCTACKKHFTSSNKSIMHKESGICPKCGNPVEYYAERYVLNIKEKISGKDHAAVFIETNDKYDIWTFCYVWRQFGNDFKPRYVYDDYIRTLKIKKTGKVLSSSYSKCGYYYGPHWTDFKEWAPNYHEVHVCPNNLEKVKEIPKYLIDEILNANYPLSIFRLINIAMSYPRVEYLCKMGLTKFVAQIPYKSKYVNFNGKSFSEFMCVTKQYLPMYKELSVTYFEHAIIQNSTGFVHPEDVVAYRALNITEHDKYDPIIIELLEHMSLKKFCSYISKQFEIQKKKSNVQGGLTPTNDYRVIVELRDYYDMLTAIGITINKKTAFPSDIRKEHHRLVKRLNEAAKQEKRHRKEIKDAIVSSYEGYADDYYTVLIPKTKQDFVKEGTELSHCVGNGTYYKNHIKGEKMIFFIRKVETPETAFFTAEIDMENGTVCQLYGYHDCQAPNDVWKFTKKFAAWLMQQKRKQLRKVSENGKTENIQRQANCA